MSDTSLATVDQVQARLPFDMDENELREATGALEDLSDEVREHGLFTWTTVDNTPPSVVNIVIKAAARHMKHYEGLVQSRAGDETAIWPNLGEDAGSATLSDREIRAVQKISGLNDGLVSVSIFAWNDGTDETPAIAEQVPTSGNLVNTPFPFFANDDDGFGA